MTDLSPGMVKVATRNGQNLGLDVDGRVADALGIGDPAVDVKAEVLAVAGGHLDHARRQVGHRAAPGHARLNQVEQEEPAAEPSSNARSYGSLRCSSSGAMASNRPRA